MSLETLERLQESTMQQLYTERGLLAQLAAHLAQAAGYHMSLVPDPDGTMTYLSIGLPTGTITVGLPPGAVHLRGGRSGPEPLERQTMNQRARAIAAFLDASG